MQTDEDLIYEHIAKRIRELRASHPQTEQKTTQEQLAKACGIERSTLTNIELCNQRPTISVIYRVCDYFGIGLSDVLPDMVSIYSNEMSSIKLGSNVHSIDERTAEVIENLRNRSRA